MDSRITGNDLIAWGFEPGQGFSRLLVIANNMRNSKCSDDFIAAHLKGLVPTMPVTVKLLNHPYPYKRFIEACTEDERDNVKSVVAHMDELMRTPTIVRGAVMPDACPSGSAPGTIPVGGVVATRDAIHPGFHSADICCSMAVSFFEDDMNPSALLDIAMKATHFGPGKRSASEVRQNKDLVRLLETFTGNPFLKDLETVGTHHFMTQGDGNHFLYVGRLDGTGQLALVTHHGSRGLGAQLYKRGKNVAERYTSRIAPEVPKHNAWIKADSDDGRNYWGALQTIREWTKMNHFAIHDLIAKRSKLTVADRFWNEHNFVFRRLDGLYYHAKGATPSYRGFAYDETGHALIPMNMSEPILITAPNHLADGTLGFAPHGAGRNMSRTQHIKNRTLDFYERGHVLTDADTQALVQHECPDLDVRFYTGKPDISELPSAYKNARQVEDMIVKHNMATIVNRIIPRGSIMAGRVFYSGRN